MPGGAFVRALGARKAGHALDAHRGSVGLGAGGPNASRNLAVQAAGNKAPPGGSLRVSNGAHCFGLRIGRGMEAPPAAAGAAPLALSTRGAAAWVAGGTGTASGASAASAG